MLFDKNHHNFIVSTLLLCALLIARPSQADDIDDLFESEATEDFIRNNPPVQVDPCDSTTLAPLIVNLGIIPVLEENLYLRTNELNNRSLLDYPIFLPRRYRGYTATYGFDIFWNKTDRMYFNTNSSNICSYLNIGPSSLLDAITTLTEEVTASFGKEFIPYQPADVLPLFRNFTVEQRRIGAMFHAEKRFKKLFLYCFVPIYYIERNMFASEIEQEALTRVFGRLDQETQDVFAKNHLISDKFGLGDTRLSVDFQLKDSDMWGFNLGFFTTLPTAFAFTTGIQGSQFKKITCPPTIDIQNIACTFIEGTPEEKTAVLKNAESFGYKALDVLTGNLLETPLGNGGHVGLGFAFQTDSHLRNFVSRSWARTIDFRSRWSLEYLIPRRHTRYFLKNNRIEQFNAFGLDASSTVIADKAGSDSAYATSLLTFFDQQITEILFPTALSTQVHPGFIFRSTSKAFHDGERWLFAIGNDFWLQSKERLTSLEPVNGSNKNCIIDKDAFNIRNAEKPFAYQGKIWGTVSYKVLRDDIDWILSLNVDETYLKSGIGADYTVSLGIEAHF